MNNNHTNDYLYTASRNEIYKEHMAAWSRLVDSAASDKFDKYAIYASRTLAVKHPEVYLKADMRFYKHISSVPGYKNAFLENDRDSMEFLPHSQYYRSAPFSFDLLDWDAISVTKCCKDFYPDDYPFYELLDTRMCPIASTLKSYGRRVTMLEMATLRLLSAYEAGCAIEQLFLICCLDGSAWLYKNGRILDPADNSEISADSLNGITLIFNSEYSYYPLMGRTEHENYVVSGLKDKFVLPNLSADESALISKLQSVSEFESRQQESMAVIAALRSTGRYTRWFKFHDLWDYAMPAKRERAWQYYGFIEQFNIRANTLSPVTAYIAAHSRKLGGYDKIMVIDREWVKVASLPNHNHVWGHLWDECLVEYTVDESIRTKAGHCMVQACIISSILTMLGIEHYLLEGEVPGSHHYVYLPDYDFTFDNGRLQSCQNTIHWNGTKGNRVTARMHHNGKFASPIAGGHYSGSMSPAEATALLDELKAFHNDRILIYINGEHETNKKRMRDEDIPVTEDYKILLKEDWEELLLP